jgi:hypothetical protein
VDDGLGAVPVIEEREPEDARATELCGTVFAYGFPDHVPSPRCWCGPSIEEVDGVVYVAHREKH